MIGYGQLDKKDDWYKAGDEDFLSQITAEDKLNILALKKELGSLRHYRAKNLSATFA